MNQIIIFGNSRRILLISLLSSLLLCIFAVLYTIPRVDLYSQGFSFMELSNNTFIIHQGNSLHYRILFPLVSWLFGLGGNKVVLMALVFSALNIFTIIYGTLKNGFSVLQSLIMGLVLVITIPTQFPLVYGGFPDALMYFLMLLLLFTVRRGWVYWSIAGLSLLTHESVALLFPFLLLYRSQHTGTSKRVWLFKEVSPAFLLIFGTYFSYRYRVSAQMISDVLRSGAAGSQMYCVLKALNDPLTCVRQANLIGILFPLSFYGSYYYFLFIPFIILGIFIKQKRVVGILEYAAIAIACLGTFPINIDTTRIIGIVLLPLITLSMQEYFRLRLKMRYIIAFIVLTLLSPHLYVINGTLRYFLGFFNIWKTPILTVHPNTDIIQPSLMHIEKSTLLVIGLAILVLLVIVVIIINYSTAKDKIKPAV